MAKKLITFRVDEDWTKILNQIVIEEITRTGDRHHSVADVIRSALIEKYPKLKGQTKQIESKGEKNGLEFNV